MADTYLNSAQSIVNGNNALYNEYFNSANAFSASEAEKSREWQEYMSNTSYQRAVKDLQSAGLNPILAVTNGGASTPSGASAHSVSGNVDTSLVASLLPSLVSSATQLEAANINQETQLESARINATSAQSVAQTNAAASKYVSDNSRAASKYSADTSYNASKYGSDTSYKSAQDSANKSASASRYSTDISTAQKYFDTLQNAENVTNTNTTNYARTVIDGLFSLAGKAFSAAAGK